MSALVLVAVGGYVVTTVTAASAATTAGCGKAPGLNSGTHTIQSSGKSRSFILRLPDSYNNNYPHRLAFGFHWLGGTANQVASGGSDGHPWAYYGMLSQSENTTIFVAPQGINNGWGNSNGEDVTFTDDMIRVIENALCVDTTQRFSVGFSYGGAMSYSLACSRPNLFRAVAAIAAPGPISGCSGGTQPVAYMGIHGINDGIQNGRALRDRFLRNNGCAAQNAPEPAPGSRTHITTTYSCRAGYPVVWAAFDGGHQQGPVDGCAGCESGARSWVKPEVWRFFSQFGSTPPPTTPPSTTPPTTPPPSSPPPSSPPPSSPPPGQQSVTIVGNQSGRCIDVPNTGNGARARLWDCTGGTNQRWTYTTNRTLTVNGKCLDAFGRGTSNGTAVVLWDCNGQNNQQWNLTTNGTITSAQSGLCLDAFGAGTANGTQLNLWSCHGGANQQWTTRN